MNPWIVAVTLFLYMGALIGGFWAVSVTDSIQGVLMALTAILQPELANRGAVLHSDRNPVASGLWRHFAGGGAVGHHVDCR